MVDVPPVAEPPTTATGDLLRLVTAGSVDDGKSTLIGRLLYDSKSILQDQLEQIAEATARRGGAEGEVDLSLLTDGLRAEREQGITIDVAYRYFATPRRRFILADTPGHVQYTRNMVTGASTAGLSIVLVDARHGVLEQTRRHALISSLLHIPHLVVAVNKMDLVDWSERRFDQIVADFEAFATRVDITDITFIPMSALVGDNVVEPSENMPWYQGPPLLYHLERVHIGADDNVLDARFPVQLVLRDREADFRGYAGQMASGVLRTGDEVLTLPSGRSTRVAAIHDFDGPREEARSGEAVTIVLGDEIDVSRGELLCRPGNQPTVTRRLDAIVCWMTDTALRPGTRVLVKHLTRTTRAEVERIVYRLDVTSGHRQPDVDELALNDLGRVTLRTAQSLTVDAYRRNRATGGFILIDEASNDTIGAGMIVDAGADPAGPAGQQVSENVVWSPAQLSRQERWDALGQGGATLWMTGLPASGKSTLGAELERRLVACGRVAYRLDGDNLRHGLNGDLGFDAASRTENVRRTAHVAAMMADAGAVAIVTLVSPYVADRDAARTVHDQLGIRFYEVHVDTPLEECERRDPKGLYARARSGEIASFTGVSDPYEPPVAPDVALSSNEPLDHWVETVLGALERAV